MMTAERMEKEGWVEGKLPWLEGKCIPISVMEVDSETGQWKVYSRYPEPDPERIDREIYETETYWQEQKDEFYDYVIRCKKCGTEFIAYSANTKKIMNFCPGCGKNLTGGDKP